MSLQLLELWQYLAVFQLADLLIDFMLIFNYEMGLNRITADV